MAQAAAEWEKPAEDLLYLINHSPTFLSLPQQWSETDSCYSNRLHSQLHKVFDPLRHVKTFVEKALADVVDAECRCAVQVDVLEVNQNCVAESTFHVFLLRVL